MYRLRARAHFDSAHYLRDYSGKCNRLHGHRWDVEAEISGKELDYRNMLVDFSEVKGLMKEICERLDHYEINVQLSEENPTAEFLAAWFFMQMRSQLGRITSATLSSITIWESPECCVTYSEEGEG